MKYIKLTVAVALLSIAASAAGQSSTYPVKPIRLVVGFPPGGASDVAARVVASKMSEGLGQPVIIENKPGAASNIAANFVAKAAPDGYTILFGTISLAINRSLYKNPGYDSVRDFVPVSLLASAPFLLVVNPSSPIRSVDELIAAAKKADADHQPIQYASAGNGSGGNLFMELLASLSGINLSHVPYRGAAPAMTDVLGGRVMLTFDNIMTTLPLIKNGKLRVLAVSSKQRSKAAPDVPTLAESGVPSYDATSWFGLFTPKGTPPEVVQKLSEAAAAAVKTKEASATLHGVGAEPIGTSPGEFDTFFKAEVDKWSQVIHRANVQVD